MAISVNPSLFWTSEEILTKTGFHVAPANTNPSSEEVSFLVMRINDKASSDLCRQIERMSKQNGGIVIRGSQEFALSAGFGSNYYTHLFHENCRCRLIVKPRALYGQMDVLDMEMAAGSSALSYNELYRAEKNLEESAFKSYTSPAFKAKLRDISSFNFHVRTSD